LAGRELGERLAGFALELGAEQMRLIEFGRSAAHNRSRRGLGKPETFSFLGFTHICAKTRKGRFKLKRVTDKKQMRAKLGGVRADVRRRMHLPVPDQGRWCGVSLGHFNYYAVRDNSAALAAFRYEVGRAVAANATPAQPAFAHDLGAVRATCRPLATTCPRPSSWSQARFAATTQGGSPVS
jgi:RNA-directed DNA polymerase